MRKNIVAGNWKMNTTIDEAVDLVTDIKELLKKNENQNAELIVAPPFVNIPAVYELLKDTSIGLSAQNCAAEEHGAYTGEVSAPMLKSIGCSHVILGHSERRAYYGETNATLSRKVPLALKNNLQVIFCIGERLLEREKEEHFKVVEIQLKETVFELSKEDFLKIVIAYEPVWAIGTGVTATPQQAQDMHAYLRYLIEEKYDLQTAENTTILYGGSCKPSNAAELFANKDVDGGLIGGASLKAEDFMAIANAFK